MELRHLRYLVAVANELKFAARRATGINRSLLGLQMSVYDHGLRQPQL
jgi:hypothetical protein